MYMIFKHNLTIILCIVRIEQHTIYLLRHSPYADKNWRNNASVDIHRRIEYIKHTSHVYMF